MSTRKTFTKKDKIIFGLLSIIFLFSFFSYNKKNEKSIYNVQSSDYPEEIKNIIDSSLIFFNTIDSTLNELTGNE
jgi:hypothetical protein